MTERVNINLKDEVRWAWPLELQHDGEQRMVRVLPVAVLRERLKAQLAKHESGVDMWDAGYCAALTTLLAELEERHDLHGVPS